MTMCIEEYILGMRENNIQTLLIVSTLVLSVSDLISLAAGQSQCWRLARPCSDCMCADVGGTRRGVFVAHPAPTACTHPSTLHTASTRP